LPSFTDYKGLLPYTNIHYYFHKTPPLVATQIRLNPFHTLEINSEGILPFMSWFGQWFLSVFLIKFLFGFIINYIRATWPHQSHKNSVVEIHGASLWHSFSHGAC
jgi:hypothetical protein